MKIVILQPVPYHRPEGVLSQYHGAIWAEELQRRGHDAIKMVIGDPSETTPDSPLLSLSTIRQRLDPNFWRELGADIVLSYGGFATTDLRLVRAVKTGSPNTRLIARVEGLQAPRKRSLRASIGEFPARYVAARHCPTESFSKEKAPVVTALLRAVAQTVRSLAADPAGSFLGLAETADAVTLFFPRLVKKTQSYLESAGRTDLLPKIHWAGYPVRREFAIHPGCCKKSGHVISVANWRHFKDPELTADAMAIVLRERSDATYTVVGERSDRIAHRILARLPGAGSRIRAMDHVDNHRLPELMTDAVVFLLCSHREGIPSVLSEALCCGCSLALAPGAAVGAFRDYLAEGDGTLARSRHPRDMAHAVLRELDAWTDGSRKALDISQKWDKTRVRSLCDDLALMASLPTIAPKSGLK